MNSPPMASCCILINACADDMASGCLSFSLSILLNTVPLLFGVNACGTGMVAFSPVPCTKSSFGSL